jgi:GTP cyclohydrolase II
MEHFEALQALLNETDYVGLAGGDHAVYHAVAETQIGKSLHIAVPPNEYKVPELYAHLQEAATQEAWGPICSVNPLGMDGVRPSISATPANMEIPEIMSRLRRDGEIVNPDGSIRVIKLAVDPVWHLPRLAEAVGVEETALRQRLAHWTQNDRLLDESKSVFLPSIGGTTLYLFGDPSAITDPERELSCRPHDECNGSDVFGTDICTCRPYLVYAVQDAVETAQRGGCGIIAYYRKEGRALGEVTKFRVYNSRKYQTGGDRAETYFQQTADIAGIEDARVQELMPDPLRLLGVQKIDRLLSMSKDKYDALVGSEIEIVNRISLPESWVPANATVEITAKIAAGYNAFQPEVSDDNSTDELWSLDTVRARSHKLLDLGLKDELPHFTVDTSKMPEAVESVLGSISKRYPDMKIPIHSRYRQFECGGVNRLRDLEMSWAGDSIDAMEAVRRKIDLVVVSVLLDAGAGADWRYHDASGTSYNRSEGLAVASMDMFRSGAFAQGDGSFVDAAGLLDMRIEELADGFQVSDAENPMAGLEGRLAILHRLGVSLQTHHEIFQRGEHFRPGNILDHVLHQAMDGTRIVQDSRLSLRVLWKAVVEGLGEVFPDPSGKQMGDCWHHSSLGAPGSQDSMVPFHKLCQWLTYSLIEPFEAFGIEFVDNYLLTGLAEYRNGGLFVDSGVLVPRDPAVFDVPHEVGSELVVEWRALTVGLCDKTAESIWDRLGVTQQKMPLAQILEGGTWAAGRELAFAKRPETGDPPIMINSKGDVF